MMAALGVIVGFVFGARGGKKRLEEIAESIEYITRSREFTDMIAIGGMFAAHVLREGFGDAPGREARRLGRLAGFRIQKELDARLGRPTPDA